MSEHQRTSLSTPDALDKFVEGLLSEAETEALAQELSSDPDLTFDLDSFGETIALLQSSEIMEPPDIFVWQVQQRIRRRTRGRWFGSSGVRTFVMEAAVCSVLFMATIAMYVISMPVLAPPTTDGAASVKLHAADVHLLEAQGQIATVGMPILGDSLEIELVVPKNKLDVLQTKLNSHPRLQMGTAAPIEFNGSVMVRIQAYGGVQSTPF